MKAREVLTGLPGRPTDAPIATSEKRPAAGAKKERNIVASRATETGSA